MARPQKLQQSMPILWRLLRRFAPYLPQHRTLIAGSFLALFAEVLLRLLEPWPLKFIIDSVIVPAATTEHPTVTALHTASPTTLLWVSALTLVAITGLRALAAYLNTVGFALTGNRVLTAVRNDLYRHLQGLSLRFHKKARSGDLIVRVVGDVGILKEVVVTAFLPLLGNLFILLGMLAVMFWMHWQLALVALTTAPLFWLSTLRLSRRIQHVARKQRRHEGSLANTAAESIGAIETVQALSLAGTFAEGFSSQSQGSLKEGVKAKRLAAKLERTVDVLNAVATALVLWFGARIVLRQELTLGELLVFLAYLRSAFRPVRNFAKYAGRIAKASAAGERVLEVLERTPEVQDLPGAVPAPAFRGALRFEGVQFAYEPGHPVVRHIDFEIPAGQRLAVVGRSGSGKSTLVGLTLRLYDPTAGRVLIDDQDLRRYTLASLRAQISVVLQDTLLFATSVRDNIAYGAAGATAAEVTAAARFANAAEFIDALPDGYDTLIGERGVTLSTGQRQRLAVARAAIRKAPILILDEPVTGLDEENARAVMDALDRLAQRRTTLLVTHNLLHAARCDLILFLEHGRIVERGTHAQLLCTNGRYATIYRLQRAGQRDGAHMETAHAIAG